MYYFVVIIIILFSRATYAVHVVSMSLKISDTRLGGVSISVSLDSPKIRTLKYSRVLGQC